MFIDRFGVYPDNRGMSEEEKYIDEFCQAIMDAQKEKRK